MAAGLYIHSVDGIDEDLLTSIVGTNGSAPFADVRPGQLAEGGEGIVERIAGTDRVLLGEGPWSDEEPDAHPLPAPLARIGEAVPAGAHVVDDDFIARILVPFDRLDVTPYRLGRPGEIWRFLRRHEGTRVMLAIRPDEQEAAAEAARVAGATAEVAAATEPAAATEVAAATEPAAAAEPTAAGPTDTTATQTVEGELQPVVHDPAFGRPIPTIDGVRPLALVLVTTQQRAPGTATWRERVLAALATIGTFGAGLAAGAGLNNLIR